MTSDDSWEKNMKEVEEEQQLIKRMSIGIKEGQSCFKHFSNRQEGCIHPSSKKEGFLQFTYFDQYGAVGDLEAETEIELARKIVEMNFVPCDKADFKYGLLAIEEKVISNKERTLER